MKHFDIEWLKTRLDSIRDNFQKKCYFTANDEAKNLQAIASSIFEKGNISQVLFDAICAVRDDMQHAYDHSNFDGKAMLQRLKFASTKSNKNNVVPDPFKAAHKKATTKISKKSKKK
ncbi:hypothetical protein NVP2275O_081 [Vibrio phage 2.275.O._10N.286.54.E11]|nr:hypothetical protein NVP2275O_081 [Vibrio phage 2.275.O._10N.286.54.E11]